MFYEFDLTIPAGTPVTSPVTLPVRLNKGVVTGVEVWFPPGVAGRALLAIDRADVQVWPSNPDVGFKGDGIQIHVDEHYQLEDEPLSFVLRGWSPDSRFAHTVTVRFELFPFDLAGATGGPLGLLRRISDFLGIGG